MNEKTINIEKEMREGAQKHLGEMFSRIPFMQRWEPVSSEMIWVLLGCNDLMNHQMRLPLYCYNILNVQRRTILKAFPRLLDSLYCTDPEHLAGCKTLEEAKQVLIIDWHRVGRFFGIWERCMRFLDLESDTMLEQEGLADLTPDEEKRAIQFLLGDGGLEQIKAKLGEQEPGKPLEQIIEELLKAGVEKAKSASSKLDEYAYQWSPDAMANFNAGIADGMKSFIDGDGQLTVKSKRQNIYEFLLFAWPEVKEMQEASPQKNRNDLWEWICPVSYAGWIEISDLDQLNDVCDNISLKLAKPGPPRKVG